MGEQKQNISNKLKELRNKTGLSVGALSEKLGYATPSGYQHYEDRYKKEWLPPDLIKGLKKILVPYGIKEEEINALAGIESNPSFPASQREKEEELFLNIDLYEQVNKEAIDIAKSGNHIDKEEFFNFIKRLYDVAEKKGVPPTKEVVDWMYEDTFVPPKI